MKLNYYLIVSVMVAAGAVAQNNNNALAPVPGPAEAAAPAATPPVAETNAPVKKAPAKHRHKSAKKAAAKASAKEAAPFAESPITLVPGPAEVFVSDLNVRGQAGLKGEVVAHLQKGDVVTVLGQINLDTHKADEPAQWAKIALPQGSDVWVRSSFINESDKTVIPKHLNLRAGPSEEYSVLGVVDRGTVVNQVGAKGEWAKIEPPTNAFAFVAAMYLKQEASSTMPVNPSPSTETAPVAENNLPPTPTTVPEPSPIMTETPAPPQSAPPQPIMPSAPENNNAALTPPPVAPENGAPGQPSLNESASAPETSELPPPPRIVTHEGYVRDSISLVAPTYYELYDPTTSKAINYLHSTTTNLDLSRYDGFQIIVTGEEGLDSRWKDTPVLSVQRIYVVSTNTPVIKVLKSPRASLQH